MAKKELMMVMLALLVSTVIPANATVAQEEEKYKVCLLDETVFYKASKETKWKGDTERGPWEINVPQMDGWIETKCVQLTGKKPTSGGGYLKVEYFDSSGKSKRWNGEIVNGGRIRAIHHHGYSGSFITRRTDQNWHLQIYFVPVVRVPDVIGLRLSEAEKAIAKARLKSGNVNGLTERSYVYGQKPKPGTVVQAGSIVTMYRGHGGSLIEPVDITHVYGKTQIKREGSDSWEDVDGMHIPIGIGDRIRTGEYGYAIIEYPRSNLKLKLRPNTNIKLRENSIELLFGDTWIHAVKRGGKFEIRTPTTSTGIRGTKLEVTVGEIEKSQIKVVEGAVDITDLENNLRITLSAGEMYDSKTKTKSEFDVKRLLSKWEEDEEAEQTATTSIFGTVGQEVKKIMDTGHSVQVWQILPEFSGAGRYRISIKHAVKGANGAFFITAWADTDGDGLPDKEIGRSNKKIAFQDGQWSSWEFTSNYANIFVGNCWDQNNERVYYKMGGTLQGYIGLGNTNFNSHKFNGIPSSKASPRYTNIRVEKF